MIGLLCLAKVNSIPIVLTFWCSSFATVGFGGVLIWRGLVGYKRASYPLTKNHDLDGVGAKVAASMIMFFGALVCFAGLAMFVACSWRLNQLLF
jgi:hypothetical protein